MLRGNFSTKVDGQGRVKIPTTLRKLIANQYGSRLFVTSITGQNVLLYPLPEWEEIEFKLSEPPKMLPEKIKFLRNTSYYGQVASMDKQGRIRIHPLLRKVAQIQDELAVMGYIHYLQVWNKKRFQSLLESDPYTDQDTLALAELGI